MVKCEGVFSPHTANLKKGVLTCDSQWFNVRRATHTGLPLQRRCEPARASI